jgi:hypothetical protein
MLKTKDLALATTLRCEGHEPIKMEMNDSREAVWVFNGCTDQIAARYEAGEMRVEPRRYNIVLRETRGDLFKYLNKQGISPRHRSAKRR